MKRVTALLAFGAAEGAGAAAAAAAFLPVVPAVLEAFTTAAGAVVVAVAAVVILLVNRILNGTKSIPSSISSSFPFFFKGRDGREARRSCCEHPFVFLEFRKEVVLAT